MSDAVILQANVAIVTVYENTARASGRIFWKVVLDTKDQFTAFDRALVARFIDGQTATTIKGRDGGADSFAYNFNPPLNTVVYFVANDKGKVLAPTPAGTAEPPVTQPAAPPPAATGTPAAGQPGPAATPPAQAPYKPPYRSYGGGQKSGGGWKPEDKRPGLVTMNEAYAKDVITAIIGNSADLNLRDPDAVVMWASQQVTHLAAALLQYSLAELKALGFKLEPEGASK